MNIVSHSGVVSRFAYRLKQSTHRIGVKSLCKAFSSNNKRRDVIQQIYVINLDRQVSRWNKIKRELHRIRDGAKTPLDAMLKRFSAIDARYNTELPDSSVLVTNYSLADQLFVEPDPLLGSDRASNNQNIVMTRQEVAVAQSHIEVWKRIASGNIPYTLVLEDDVYFRNDFARILNKTWDELMNSCKSSDSFDIFYLSYKEVKTKAEKYNVSDTLFQPLRGLWWLSGYVLSQKGAKKLLELLPVFGPVDLWINHQFNKLNVLATRKSLIDQRLDFRSDNSYSIMPVLAKVGVLTKEKPLFFKTQDIPKPVFAFGRHNTGLTSLAMAISMLGYRCCSNINELPESEHNNLFDNNKNRVFDAYVNIGSLMDKQCVELAKLYPGAKIIITVEDEQEINKLIQDSLDEQNSSEIYVNDSLINQTLTTLLRHMSANILILPANRHRKWDQLCKFLNCEYPNSPYPTLEDQEQNNLNVKNEAYDLHTFPRRTKMKFDKSPWIVAKPKNWRGVQFSDPKKDIMSNTVSECYSTFDSASWTQLNDTFPDNLAIFSPNNFEEDNGNFARLILRKESTQVRDYTSASVCSRSSFLYGRFSTIIKPANVSGLVTGVFLHRNSPKQEIDIEFLGKDASKMLVNVYYNPGGEGAKLEYGYRGTPVLIDLGFDASKSFHQYSIEWSPASINWLVDDRLVYARATWDPTPIPHLPMHFYSNLWYSRSKELAGKLSDSDLPTYSEIKTIDIIHYR